MLHSALARMRGSEQQGAQLMRDGGGDCRPRGHDLTLCLGQAKRGQACRGAITQYVEARSTTTVAPFAKVMTRGHNSTQMHNWVKRRIGRTIMRPLQKVTG